MQNRISKTLLTLLIMLKNLSRCLTHFFTEINFFSKVSKVFEILFCKHTPFHPFVLHSAITRMEKELAQKRRNTHLGLFLF